ncbi:MATE family efflux transporter [Chakrabartyella piscis]|uniref:MATE family efflux transporter n=1 Tax=Chakrabartyella piscis TaxID=2918914 RepID=UPI002958801E|nr:MATE family efflux transporter [Chakrabartyella piscis]
MIVREKHFYKSMLAIAFPIAVQNLISFLVNLLDTLMVGQLGEDSLSGVQLAGNLFFILMIIGVGVGEGMNILIAQYYGKKDMDSIRKIYPIAYRTAAVIGIVAFVIGFFFPEQFIRIYAKQEDTLAIAEGVKYLKLISLCYIPYIFADISIRSQRPVGSAHISMYIYVASLVVNASLNYILIFGKLGMPALGVRGAAIGTICARTLELILISIFLFRIDQKIKLKIKDLLPVDGFILKKFITNSAPIVFNEIVWVLASTTISIIFAKLGKQVVAANTVSLVMFQLISVFLFGISSAASVTVGNIIGAGKIHKAYDYAHTYCLLGLGIGLFSSLLVFLTKDFAIGLYNLTPQTQELAHHILNAAALVVFLQSTNMITGMGTLRGGGDGKIVLIIEMVFAWFLAVPLGLLAAFYWELPIFWVYIFAKADEIAKAIAFTARVLFSKWAKDVTN